MGRVAASLALVGPTQVARATSVASAPRWRSILGIQVAALTRDDATHQIARALADKAFLRINFLNANNANIAMDRPSVAEALKRSLVLADGIGLDLASRLLYGATFPDNLNGTDFVPALLADLATPLTVGLIGAAPGVAEAAAQAFAAQAPQHTFIAISDGFARDDAVVVAKVRAVRPDILLVAMGTPRQELWADQHINAADCAVVITVGALFDFVAGRVPRAPGLVRGLKLEWLFRLALEPRRLANRYLIGNAVFLYRALQQKRGASPTRAPAVAKPA